MIKEKSTAIYKCVKIETCLYSLAEVNYLVKAGPYTHQDFYEVSYNIGEEVNALEIRGNAQYFVVNEYQNYIAFGSTINSYGTRIYKLYPSDEIA